MNEGKTTWKWRKSCLCVGFPNGGETLRGNPRAFGGSEELAWNNQFLLTITIVKSFRSFPKPIRRSACRGLVHTQGDHCMYSWSSSWQRGKQFEILIENHGAYPKNSKNYGHVFFPGESSTKGCLPTDNFHPYKAFSLNKTSHSGF